MVTIQQQILHHHHEDESLHGLSTRHLVDTKHSGHISWFYILNRQRQLRIHVADTVHSKGSKIHVADTQNATIASEAGQNLKQATLRLVPAYRARTYTVTA